MSVSPPQRLYSDLFTLTRLQRHYQTPQELDAAAAFIARRWMQMGLVPRVDSYSTSLTAPGQSFKNLSVSVGPENAPRLVMGAHYDVFSPLAGKHAGQHHPGADDNASGVAGLLELSRQLLPYSRQLNRRIDLVAFANEEPPFFATRDMGSAHHAAMLKAQQAPVEGMVALDMIGHFGEQHDTRKLPGILGELQRRFSKPDDAVAIVGNRQANPFAKALSRSLRRNTTLQTAVLTAKNGTPGTAVSDNGNYAAQGWPAVMLSEACANPHYHQPTDTLATLNIPRLNEVIQGLTAFLTEYGQPRLN